MYPSEPTLTEHYVKQMEQEGWSQEKIINEYIDNHNTSEMMEGVRYYRKENDILNRKLYRYDERGQKIIDEFAPNNKIPSGFHKLLVDQKVGYLTGEPISIGGDDETAVEKANEYLGSEFEDLLPELVKHSSNKGVEWVHPYIDNKGNFDYIRIPAQEVIPIYDNTKRKELISVIRLIPLDDDHLKIEFHDDKTVTFYEKIDGKVVLDNSGEGPNPMPHFYYRKGEKRTGYGWGKVPFIAFDNNEERLSDLHLYKRYVDSYDLTISDATNTIQSAQNYFYVLKGYEAEEMKHFYKNIQMNKGVALSEDGDLDVEQPEPPMGSIDSILDRYADNIFSDGMGVDTSVDKFGNNPSGVALKNLYSYLDMKCSILERKFTKALHEFVWFISEYDKMIGGGGFDPEVISFTFNKSMLSNEKELVEMAQSSQGIISRETIWENHPWVKNPQTEEERMKAEEDEYMRNLEPVGGASATPKPKDKQEGSEVCPKCGGDGTVISDATGDTIQCTKCGGDGVVVR